MDFSELEVEAGVISQLRGLFIFPLLLLTTMSGTVATASAALRPEASKGFCGDLLEVVRHSRNRFVELMGEPIEGDEVFRKTLFSPAWGEDCSITDEGTASWGCNISYRQREDSKAGFKRVYAEVATCLDSGWRPHREDIGDTPGAVFSSAGVSITLLGAPTHVWLQITTER